MDDIKIIELYFERNEQAINETDLKYGRLCHSIAYNILGNLSDCEECVNDTYIGLWNAIPPTRPNNFMAFVLKIARNLSLKRLEFLTREKRAKNKLVSFSELETVLPNQSYAPNISDVDVGRIINRFLLEQKPEVRNVFIRKYFFFDTIKEIAKRYSFSDSKVKNMLFNTRNRLRDYLIKEGVSV